MLHYVRFSSRAGICIRVALILNSGMNVNRRYACRVEIMLIFKSNILLHLLYVLRVLIVRSC